VQVPFICVLPDWCLLQVLGVMHGVQQLLIHFRFLTPAPGEPTRRPPCCWEGTCMFFYRIDAAVLAAFAVMPADMA